MKINYIKKVSLIALVILFGVFFTAVSETNAATKAVNGYAWSSNIGWISFQGPGYGVSYNDTNGDLTGFAWSSNIGWIKFTPTPLYPCPPNSGCQANVSNGTVTGWVRACAATTQKNCSDGQTSSWDGWIKLGALLNSSGTGVTFDTNTGKFGGWAWGDQIVGWVKFNTGDDGVIIPPNNATPSCSLSANVAQGSTDVYLNWNITNDTSGSAYTLTRLPSTNISSPVVSGNTVDSSVPYGTYVYRLSRSGGATCQTGNVSVTDTTSMTGKLWLGNNQNTVQVTMDPEDYVDVRWSIPIGATCTGAKLSGPSPMLEWSGKSISTTPGVQRVRDLAEGDYILGLTGCVSEGTPFTVNTVKLIVSDGELEEI